MMGKPHKKTGVPDEQQFQLFGGVPEKSEPLHLRTAVDSGRRFVTGDPGKIFIGTTRLEDYLRQSHQTAPFEIAKLLDAQDWREFEARYAPTGRAPYCPRRMLGLILYGVMQGVHSLRDLERLSRLDLGCMWITGGIGPDHTNIGRFITMHEDSLTSSFFESLTRHVLKQTGSTSERVAGDGTVIEAAGSHYKKLKAEAIRARADAAKAAIEKDPDDPDAQQEKADSDRYLNVLEEREASRKRSGSSLSTLVISETEPEAMVQTAKRGRGKAASYKPSILANKDRIITALALDPSSETKVVAAMLDQNQRVTGDQTTEVLLDAGYFDNGVIAATLERDISMLCPDGRGPGEVKQGKVYPKSQFMYDEASDSYRCPVGQILSKLRDQAATKTKEAHVIYGTDACGTCEKRTACISTKRDRRIARFATDLHRDALRAVMEQPQVKTVFGQRKAMVEPVFSHLRGKQGLNRFRRMGLQGVMREFALHAIAHNISRAVALLRAFICLLNGRWRPLWLSERMFNGAIKRAAAY
jgi:transposase